MCSTQKAAATVITPYSTMNTMLVNKTVGLAWWHNMAVGKRMQSTSVSSFITLRSHNILKDLYGSSESTRVDGTATSAFVSWDSKMTTLNGLLGGVTSLVRPKLKKDGVYNEFISVVEREWGAVFGNKLPLRGEQLAYCLPNAEVPELLKDFMTCE